MNEIGDSVSTFESRTFGDTGLTREQAAILLEKGWNRKDLRKIREGGMFSLGASLALRGERGKVNTLFATFAFATVALGVATTAVLNNAENAFAHAPDLSPLDFADPHILSYSPDLSPDIDQAVLSPIIDSPIQVEQGNNFTLNIDVERYVANNGLNLNFIGSSGESPLTLKNVDCGVDSAAPQPLVFADQVSGKSVSYDFCSATINTNNRDYPGNLLIENNGGVLGREWIMLNEGNTLDVRGSSLLLPLRNGGFNVNDTDAKRLEVLKTADGLTVFHLNNVNIADTSYKTVYSNTDSKPAVYSDLQNRLINPTNSEILKSLLPKPATATVESQLPSLPRTEVPVYNKEVTQGQESFSVEQKNLVAHYVEDFPELDDVKVRSILELENPGRETISVLDFSNEQFSVNPEALGLAYDYFAKQAIKGQQLDSAGVTFTVSPSLSPDMVMGLIPSDVASRNFVLGPSGYAYTNPAWSSTDFNAAYVKLLQGPYKQISQYDIPRTSLEDTTVSIITEICQSTNVAKAIDFEKPQFTDGMGASMFAQELWCNSKATAYFFRQKGVSYNDYKKFTESVGYYFPSISGTDTFFTMLLMPEAEYSQIKTTGPILVK